jgi:hypothetical protein
MADNNKYIHNGGCKEAVCVDAGRVYDSCSDKDCLEDLRVYFSERDQMVIDHAISVRPKKAEVITTFIDVEALPFNRGYYSCDLTFYFAIHFEVYSGHGMGCSTVCGVAVFQKKVILFGSEGNVKVFASEFCPDTHDRQEMPTRNMPRCNVQVAEPVILGAKLVEKCNCVCNNDCGCSCIPACICERFNCNFCDTDNGKVVLVTLGIFTIVQLIRNVQMLMPIYDFCVPAKECCPNTESPCDMFRKMCFPVDEFFPPKGEDNCSC